MSEPDASRALERLPLLAALPEAARARLAAAARPVRHPEGGVIFRRGDPGDDGLLLILDGLVRLHLSGADGREMSLGLVGAGEPLGEIALVDGGPRSADATALTPVRGLMLRHADASAVFTSDPAAAQALLRTLAARLRRTTDQAEALGIRSLPARLAGALLKLAAADPSGLVRLSQSQLAALIAASRPKVNVVLTRFREEGLIEPVRRVGLRLRQPAALRALAEG